MPVPEHAFEVLLHGQRVGLLRQRGAITRFELDESYLDDPNRAVFGLIFEQDLPARHSDKQRLPPWFANLLPEGQLRRWIAIERGVPLIREVELLTQIGHDLPGAVGLRPTEQVPDDEDAWTEPNRRRPGRHPVVGLRFSLAGVTMKFSMVNQGQRLTLPAVNEQGDWIVKLPDGAHPNVPHNEYAMMALARTVGVEVPEIHLRHRDDLPELPSLLWPDKEVWAYSVRRFDRDHERVPVHIEDLAQVRDIYPDDKYRSNFETVASLVYRRRDIRALHEFARRMIFNVLIGNSDAHLKNWSLIYRDRRIPTLSPAYDLVSTAPYGYGADLGMPFLGIDRLDEVTFDMFSDLERKLEVSADLPDIARQVTERVVAAWPEHAESLAKLPNLSSRIGEHIVTTARRLLS
jgi:serine/threonine-protein kinase HipA